MKASSQSPRLPPGVTVFERGWLSSNGILLADDETAALVDTGYASHSAQTVALVRRSLGERPLERILNTHLHSDHCGGNAALQGTYPGVRTLIPPGMARFVHNWDPVSLGYTPTGQQCPRFRMDSLLEPGGEVVLAGAGWQIHAAPGHDPHSVILFEPDSGTLISADALWENGFGIVFEELEGTQAFDGVGATLDLIESLAPRVVIPGHGPVFSDVGRALASARSRLAGFINDPRKHAKHAGKVLLKFRLLELQRIPAVELVQWASQTPYFFLLHQRFFAPRPMREWVGELVSELIRSGAARSAGDQILNA